MRRGPSWNCDDPDKENTDLDSLSRYTVLGESQPARATLEQSRERTTARFQAI